MNTVFRLTSLMLFLTLSVGCSQPTMKDEPSAEFAAEELYPVRNTGFAQAFVRRDANLAGYRALDVRPLGVSQIEIPTTFMAGTSRRDWEITPERQAVLRDNWADAMSRAFPAYSLTASGPGVLRVEAELTRIAPGRPTATTIGGDLQPMGSTRDAVEISAEFRLFDGGSGKLLAVVRDSRTITGAALSRTAPITVTMLFRSWAQLLHTRISGR